MNWDVLAHYFFGIISMLVTGILVYEFKKKKSSNLSRTLFGLIVLCSGIVYLHIILGNFELSPTVYSKLSASNKQHVHISLVLFFLGIMLICLRTKDRLHKTLRSLGMVTIGIILFLHNQPHSHGHAPWVTPYHRVMSTLLFLSAASILFALKYPKKYQIYVKLVPIVSLFIIGVMLFVYHDPSGIGKPCRTTGQIINIKISDDKIEPNNISSKRCDYLHITSGDGENHELAFGDHEHHQHYGAAEEKKVKANTYHEILLNIPGKFNLHDHYNDETTAQLEVTK